MDGHDIENHPDLRDPDWQRYAEKEAWIELRRTRRRNRRVKRLAWTAAGLVAVVAAAFAVYRWGKTTSEHYDASATGIPTTTQPAPSVLPEIAKVDLSRPFDNTPAQAWGSSVDGLSVPPAAKTGTFSAAQVQAGYDKVKGLINAAHLDRRMLEGHDTSAYLALLATSEQNRLRPILADRGKDDFAGYVTMLADGFHLLPAGPRITGRLSASAGDQGELVVHAEFVVAYAFDPGSHGPITSPSEIDAFHRFDVRYSILTSPPYGRSDAGLVLDGGSGEVFSMACGAANAGYLAPVYSEEATGSGPSGSFDEPAMYDVNKPLPQDDGCK